MHEREPLPENWQSHPSFLLGEPPPFSIFRPEDAAAFVVAADVPIIDQDPQQLYRLAATWLDHVAFSFMTERRARPMRQRSEVLLHAEKLQRACAALAALLGQSASIESYDQDLGHTDQVRAAMGLAAAEEYMRQLGEEWAPSRELELAERAEVEKRIREREAKLGPKYVERLKRNRRLSAADEYARAIATAPLPGDEYIRPLWAKLRDGAEEARGMLNEPDGLIRALQVIEASAAAQLDRFAQRMDEGGPRTDFTRHWFVLGVCRVYHRFSGRRPAASESRKTGLFIGPAPRFLAAVCACFSERLHHVEIASDSELRHVLQGAVTEDSAGGWIDRARDNLASYWDFSKG
jgi:hypothetical protein